MKFGCKSQPQWFTWVIISVLPHLHIVLHYRSPWVITAHIQTVHLLSGSWGSCGSCGSCGSFYHNYRSGAVVLWWFLHFDGKCRLHFASLRSLYFMAKCTKLPQLPLWSGSFYPNYHNYRNYRKQMNSLIVLLFFLSRDSSNILLLGCKPNMAHTVLPFRTEFDCYRPFFLFNVYFLLDG